MRGGSPLRRLITHGAQSCVVLQGLPILALLRAWQRSLESRLGVYNWNRSQQGCQCRRARAHCWWRVAAGSLALPTLLKLATVMAGQTQDFLTCSQLPVVSTNPSTQHLSCSQADTALVSSSPWLNIEWMLLPWGLQRQQGEIL